MNRRELLQQLSCAMAVAGIASTIPLSVHARPREVGDTDVRFSYYDCLEIFFQPPRTNTGPATINPDWLVKLEQHVIAIPKPITTIHEAT